MIPNKLKDLRQTNKSLEVGFERWTYVDTALHPTDGLPDNERPTQARTEQQEQQQGTGSSRGDIGAVTCWEWPLKMFDFDRVVSFLLSEVSAGKTFDLFAAYVSTQKQLNRYGNISVKNIRFYCYLAIA